MADISKEELGDLVEKELQSTHETIDEAVRQLEVRSTVDRDALNERFGLFFFSRR